ncbi:MAG TPA: twin transmembrane helix small protein [Acetobacteraceae bacterium]|nr:twin transmembrane helix small protein [Acetobacteraceae bacterium]
MKVILVVLLVLSMAGVLGVLFAGMFGLVRGGGDPRRSNALMRWRIVLQGVALLLFLLLLGLIGH